jgi:Tol biopolymer transport system component/DNA-binding winged helix-turn-helix (wHTH) protein
MPRLAHTEGIVRFGTFAVDLAAGVLRKHGTRIKLQTQPFQVLAALLENPGAVVTREELRRRLWANDTFVDFEHGMNAAVARLRLALGDSAERPRYVETLAKRGYRFIGEVKHPVVVLIDAPHPVAAVARSEPKRWPAKLIFTAAALVAIAAVALRLIPKDPVAPPRPLPLTAFHGSEQDPALSPDGKNVAFAWNGEREDNFDIYVLPIGSVTPRRITSNAADDLHPAWSPDGRTIAFLRRLGDDLAALVLIPSTGGPEHRIADVRNDEMRRTRLASLAWSPDGRWLAVSHRELGPAREGIYLFSLTGEKRQLTSPPQDAFGDHMPAFSPDGRKLAFCRLSGFTASEIFLLSLDPSQEPRSESLPLTSHKRWSTNPVWINEGREILYILAQSGNLRTRREVRITSAFGKALSERSILPDDEVWQISAGRNLVYSRRTDHTNIWHSRIPAPGEAPGLAELFISSTLDDGKARYSPDGSKISFVSSRSGSEEVWIANADGSDPVRLTSFGGPLIGPPAWSPDGQWLVFHARPEGQADLFVMPAAGGTARRFTYYQADETMPNYSRDGRWVYFTSMRSGRQQIWKIPSAGGNAEQVTTGGGMRPIESVDGKTIYYISDTDGAIRQKSITDGIERQVAAPVCREGGFAVTADGLVYPAPTHGVNCEFRLLTPATGLSRPIVQTAGWTLGMVASVSPDGRHFLFEEAERPGMDLMLVENFRIR